MRLIDADELLKYRDDHEMISTHLIWNAPTIEPNLILPERMERGECYEVGETIVVLNHDDYYDLLCKSTVDKDYLVSLIQEAVYDGEACKRLLDLVDRPQGEWIRTGRTNIYGGIEVQCSNCGDKVMVQHLEDEWYCRHCGADMGMKGADDE